MRASTRKCEAFTSFTSPCDSSYLIYSATCKLGGQAEPSFSNSLTQVRRAPFQSHARTLDTLPVSTKDNPSRSDLSQLDDRESNRRESPHHKDCSVRRIGLASRHCVAWRRQREPRVVGWVWHRRKGLRFRLVQFTDISATGVVGL
jgi:hypothetical protein